MMYEDGRRIPQDFAEAAKWYRRAAEQGDAGAKHALGSAYSMGKGVARDYVLAHMWYDLASLQFTERKEWAALGGPPLSRFK